MTIGELIRLESGNEGAFGKLKIDKRIFCDTLEPKDMANMPNISCIPTGQYICRRFKSPRFGETFRVEGVPGRYGIEFHPVNIVQDTEGCIGLGQYTDKMRGNRGIKNSGDTFKAFMLELAGEDEFHLTITEHY